MRTQEFARVREAYLQMARVAKYRPKAPSDGFGNIQLTDSQLDNDQRLEEEASAYARDFIEEENTRQFHVGVSDYRTNRAFVYTIEVARLLCAGGDSALFVKKLLQLAVADIERAEKEDDLKPSMFTR